MMAGKERKMVIKREADRSDQTDQLGKPLSRLQLQCYLHINNSDIEPISATKLYKELYGYSINHKDDKEVIWGLIGGIRKKLGNESIITRKDWGYITRTSFIQDKVGNKTPDEIKKVIY